MITFGSLFSGVGGFDLGFEQAGMKCAWQVEIDKDCQSVLRKHWSETELFDDVRTVGKHNLKPVDVICGGFPCQDVSIAGKRAGLAGERSGLWSEFARIIDELEPKWVVIENVPGLLSSNRGRDFATVIRWLAERGYGVAWRILDSQYFGVAQRRRRVFIVGSFGNGSASEILFEREGVRWNTPQSWRKGRTYSGNPKSSAEVGAAEFHAYTISQQDDGRNGGRGGMSISETMLSVGISSKSKTVIVQNGVPGVRRFTPVETERLHGFPDEWTDSAPESQRYKQMGNAVSVPVSKWIARRILLVDDRSIL